MGSKFLQNQTQKFRSRILLSGVVFTLLACTSIQAKNEVRSEASYIASNSTVLQSSTPAPWESTVEELRSLEVTVLDFDDTVMFTKAKIYMYSPEGEEVGVSTKDFAEIGEYVGKDLTLPTKLVKRLNNELKSYLHRHGIKNLKDFKFDTADDKSFRDFRKSPSGNVALEKMEEAVEDKSGRPWKGPRFQVFVKASEAEETAKNLYLLSARGNPEMEMHEGLKRTLLDRGYVKNLLPKENMILVGAGLHPELGTSSEEKKKNFLVSLADRIQRNVETLVNQKKEAAKQAGVAVLIQRPKARIVFADDDYQNFEKALHGLDPLKERWPDVNLLVEYVGEINPDHKAHSVPLKVDLQKLKCPGAFRD